MSEKNISQPRGCPTAVFYVGLLLLLCATIFSFLLASTKLGILTSTPGCGEGSGCDAITNGPWGTVPGIGWPVSFLGLAWFITLFFGWLRYKTSSRSLLWVVRLGVLGSFGFIGIMVSINSFCQWCVLAHVCNILFWILAELMFRREGSHHDGGGSIKPIRVMAIAFFVVSMIFWGLNSLAIKNNINIIVGGTSDKTTLKLLDARHRLGSANAPIQVVMFTDYQCPDCKNIEAQLAEVMRTRDDVAVSVKHFPMCFNCNDNIGTFNLHPNACWAARAAEAAFILGGEDGWKRMHTWLFDQGGSFTDTTFPPSLAALGFNPNEFVKVMMGEETMRLVKEDTNDADALGIYFTPMVFINGVEYLWYYGGQGSIKSIISAVGERVKGGDASITAPPSASDKFVEDWRRGSKRTLPGSEGLSWRGDGPIEIVVWSDYQSPLTAELEKNIRTVSDSNPRVKYAFRHFPIDEDCNSSVSNMPSKYAGSCFIAKLIESVDVLAGHDARWDMHDWLIQQKPPIKSAAALAKAASLAGVDQFVVQDVTKDIGIQGKIQKDIATKNIVWRRSIPVITIDGRLIPRWGSDVGEAIELFRRIIDVVEDEMKRGEDPKQ